MRKLNIKLLVAGWSIEIVIIAQDEYIVNNWVSPVDIYDDTFGEGRGNFYASGDINGIVDESDQSMLEDHLATHPFSYPSWYYPKLDRSGQEEIILNAMKIADTEDLSASVSSSDYGYEPISTQFYINFRGISQDNMDYLEGLGGYEYN